MIYQFYYNWEAMRIGALYVLYIKSIEFLFRIKSIRLLVLYFSVFVSTLRKINESGNLIPFVLRYFCSIIVLSRK